MWDLGNRATITLVSVLSGCVFLYNIWGPILVLTVSLFLTIYACYSLIVNDSLLSPHALLLFDYCKYIFLEVRASVENIIGHVNRYIRTLWEVVNRRFRERYLTNQIRMDRRRGAHYQLSSDPYPIRRNSSGFSTIAQLSPIARTSQNLDVNDVRSENKFYHDSDHSSYNHSPFGKHTSTPMFPRNKEELENEPVKLLPSDQVASKRMFHNYTQNHTLSPSENATYFGTQESSWGSSISPNVRSRVNEAKAAQTVGGPLLVMNRCNIDSKVYHDVNSPGLTTRLTKYAAEANSKLTHQSQYRVGQFPKVNLNASPVPLINAKSMKARTPVIVRVAPPDAVLYSQKPGTQKILPNLCHSENICDLPLAAIDTREISLKRHASREDVTSDLAKKQRTESIVSKEFETQDETKQKRSRDESSKSEDSISPQNKTARPTKRTKTPSCYDILNSLSSSKHVISGVKRKARDFSRSGTPDFEKHFKSLESVQNAKVSSSETQTADEKYSSPNTVEQKNSDTRSSPKVQEHSPLKGILKTKDRSSDSISNDKNTQTKIACTYNGNDRSAEASVSTESAKLTNKLFMRAEPERNEKLRMLVEEQGNIRAKFTTDDVEEIKKEDIINMRQTSMKARLQSMFDAISGKASRINPDVVIQAEEVNAAKSVSCPVTCATLNSSTTTTNVNTTPISTSAVAPSPATKQSITRSPKHVSFTLPNQEVSSNSNISINDNRETTVENVSSTKADSTTSTAGITFTTASSVAPVSSSTSNLVLTNSNLDVQNVNFGKPALTTAATSITSPSTFSLNSVSSNEATAATSLVATSTGPSLFGNFTSTTPKSSFVPVISTASDTKSDANKKESTSASQMVTKMPSNSSTETFGSGGSAFVSLPTNIATPNTIAMKNKQQTTEIASVTSNTSNTTPFKITTTANAIVSTSAPASTTSLFTFGSKTNTMQSPKPETFVFGSTSNVLKSGNVFGNLTNTQAATTTNNTSTNAIPSALQNSASDVAISSAFNSSAKPTMATFGSSTTQSPGFTFGAPNSASLSSKSGFSFGSVTSTTNALTGTSSSTTAFGAANNNPSLSFTTPVNAAAPQFSSNNASIFGNTATTASIFGTMNSQPVFGNSSTVSTTSSTFVSLAPKSTTTPVFDSTTGSTNAGTTSTNSLPVFSTTTGGSSSGIGGAAATPIFGSVTSTSAPAAVATNGNLFSNVNSTTSTPGFGGTTNIFGQAQSPSGGVKTAASAFSSNPMPLFGSQATTTSTFGSTNISSNATIPAFGSTNASSNAIVPTFAATSTTTSAFGTQNNASFGSKPPAFGADAGSTSVFGSSTATSPFNPPISNSTFGGQSVSSSTFGTSGSVPAFTDNKSSPFETQASAFGTPSAPAAAPAPAAVPAAVPAPVPVFGSAPANVNSGSASNIFTFGANQKPPQQNSSFSFGNNSANTAATPAANAAPFQFGATTSNPATGFNFSAPTTTPSINFGTTSAPTFNASAPGMFNIGSGSTAPRSRNIRTRKPR